MLTGRDVMNRVGVLLLDEEHIRWPLPELADWINSAIKAILLAKPSAASTTIALPMAKGTLQSLPADGTPEPLALLGIVRNLKRADPREGGRMIRPTTQATLDAVDPNWHDPAWMPYRKEVRQYCFDEAVPTQFYVWPGNDGTGLVEAKISYLPTPLAASGDPTSLDSYAADIGLSDLYSEPVLDYVCYRAHSKDSLDAQAGRAMAHYQAFATALGMKIQVEGATSPNSGRATK